MLHILKQKISSTSHFSRFQKNCCAQDVMLLIEEAANVVEQNEPLPSWLSDWLEKHPVFVLSSFGVKEIIPIDEAGFVDLVVAHYPVCFW